MLGFPFKKTCTLISAGFITSTIEREREKEREREREGGGTERGSLFIVVY